MARVLVGVKRVIDYAVKVREKILINIMISVMSSIFPKIHCTMCNY